MFSFLNFDICRVKKLVQSENNPGPALCDRYKRIPVHLEAYMYMCEAPGHKCNHGARPRARARHEPLRGPHVLFVTTSTSHTRRRWSTLQ